MSLWIRLIGVAALLAVPAGAQTTNPDEWSNPFSPKKVEPPPKPAAAPPKAAEPPPKPVEAPPKPIEPPKQAEPPPKPVETTAKPAEPAPKPAESPPKPVESPKKEEASKVAAAAAATAEAEEATVISTQERFLPGSEPHSPGTWGRAFIDPRNLRHSSSTAGGVGLLRMSSADLGPPGLLRFSATGEYFTSRNFPVRDALDVRSAGTFAVSYVPVEFLETYLAYSATANTNSRSSPRLIQSLGDLAFGAKGSRRWAQGLFAGLDARLLTYAPVGNQDVRRFAFGFAPHALLTYDFRETWPTVPLRLHANVGAILDGSGQLVQQHTLTASEEFALGIHKYHRFSAGVGLEAPLPAATPFVEWWLQVPLGVKDGVLPSPDGQTIPVSRAMPHRIGFGVRVTAVRDLTVTAAADLGLTRGVGLGVPATPPYNIYLAAAFTVDPVARGETKLVETVRERKRAAEPLLPKTAKIEGVVLDAQTKKPVPGVIVAMVGAGLPPVASDADSGRFITHELQAGPVRLEARKDGYKEAAQDVILEPGKTAEVELALDPLAKLARFLFSVTAKKKPVAATIQLHGAAQHQVPIPDGAKEPVKAEAPAGKYTVEVTAPGHLAQTREVQISENAEMAVAFDLQPEPKKRLVIVKENKIEILQQVHFATGKSAILADSFPLLAQVVDAIITNNVKRVRIEGHTDNKGNKAKNLKLSQDRASSVADHLEKSGIDRSRLDTAGFGDTRPVAPNMTPKGRELNRRVEFIILER